MAEKIPFNQQIDRLSGVSSVRNRSTVPENVAENMLARDSLNGEKYQQRIRRQRAVSQRMRQLSEGSEIEGGVRKPRNARFKEQNSPKKERLDRTDIGKMVGVALLFDLISGVMSLVPIIGNALIGVTVFPLATLTLYIMYTNRGIEFKDGKMLTRFWGSLLLKFVPVLSVLPEYTLNVVLVTTMTKAEDKLK